MILLRALAMNFFIRKSAAQLYAAYVGASPTFRRGRRAPKRRKLYA